MSAIDELLISIGIDEGSNLEELYKMLKTLELSGGKIKIEAPDNMPTKSQISGMSRRITMNINRLHAQLITFPELFDKIKELIQENSDELINILIKFERIEEIKVLVGEILPELLSMDNERKKEFNEIIRELLEIRTGVDEIEDGQTKTPREVAKSIISRSLFQGEMPKLTQILPGEEKPRPTAMGSLVETLLDIITNKKTMSKLGRWKLGPAQQLARGTSPQGRTDISDMMGLNFPAWKEGMKFVERILEEVEPFLGEFEQQPTGRLIESLEKLDDSIDFNHKVLNQLKGGFQSTQKFERTISTQITNMDSRVKDIHDKVTKESPEENIKKDKANKGKIEK